MSYYYFELVMAGAILLTAMTGIGITLMIKRRKTEPEDIVDEKNQVDVESSKKSK